MGGFTVSGSGQATRPPLISSRSIQAGMSSGITPVKGSGIESNRKNNIESKLGQNTILGNLFIINLGLVCQKILDMI